MRRPIFPLLAALVAALFVLGCSSTGEVKVKPDEKTSVVEAPPDTVIRSGPAPAPSVPVSADTSEALSVTRYADSSEQPTFELTSMRVLPAQDKYVLYTPTGRLTFDLPEEGERATIKKNPREGQQTAQAGNPTADTTGAPPNLTQLMEGTPSWTYEDAQIPDGAGESWIEQVWGTVQSWVFYVALIGMAAAIAWRLFSATIRSFVPFL